MYQDFDRMSDWFSAFHGAPRVMSSKKKPMMLHFTNADPRSMNTVQILFKNGDDLRQDILTLQLLKVMDQVPKLRMRF